MSEPKKPNRSNNKTNRRGRRAGIPNRKTKELAELLEQELPDFHPLIAKAKIAHFGAIERLNPQTKKMELQPIADDLRVKCLCELSQFLYPKRKAIEHSGGIDTTGGVLMVERVMSADEWEKKGNK